MPFVGGALEEPQQDCVTKTEIAYIIGGGAGGRQRRLLGGKRGSIEQSWHRTLAIIFTALCVLSLPRNDTNKEERHTRSLVAKRYLAASVKVELPRRLPPRFVDICGGGYKSRTLCKNIVVYNERKDNGLRLSGCDGDCDRCECV